MGGASPIPDSASRGVISAVRALILSALIIFAAAPAMAQSGYTTDASHAVILDFETGEILFSQNGDEPMAPSSMSKMMTVLMTLEAIEAGRLSMDDELPVSEHAWRTGGAASGSSTMFLELGSRVSVRDLLYGVIVQSGNDACIVLAEAISGSEEAFAEESTARARELGLTSANFANATGWPHPEHRISANDLARLAQILIRDHPAYYDIWAETEFTHNGIRQFNRNPLLGVFRGADGLKTGHTEEAGYGLVGSAEQDGVRRIIVFNGMDSNAARAQEAERMMRAAINDFELVDLYAAGAEIADAAVFMGVRGQVPMTTTEDLRIALHRRARRNMTVEAVYDGPIAAPIAQGDEIGRLVVSAPGMETREFPLVAAEAVELQGLMGRIGTALAHLIRGGA